MAIRRGRGAAAEHPEKVGGRSNVNSLPSRRRRGSQAPAEALTVHEMLGEDAMRGARIIAGADGLGRPVRRLNLMPVPNIVRWTKQDEFLLTTGYPLPRQPEEFCRLIEQLAAKGLAGLAAARTARRTSGRRPPGRPSGCGASRAGAAGRRC